MRLEIIGYSWLFTVRRNASQHLLVLHIPTGDLVVNGDLRQYQGLLVGSR
jgi:hypothetical protein